MAESVHWEICRDIPVAAAAEICVIGGGPGGLAAAVTAARQGRDVLLVERYGAMGGMALYGEVSPFMFSHLDGEALDRPVYGEWRRAMRDYRPETKQLGPFEPFGQHEYSLRVAKDTAMLAAEDLALAAGVRLLYHHNLVDVVKREGRIAAAVFSTKGGFVAVKAAQFIDSTGDGDLAALAGCPVEFGDDSGHCQPMTLCFKLANVDPAKMPSREKMNEILEAGKQRGDIRLNPRENLLWFLTVEDDVIHFNTTRVVCKSGINGADLSAAEIAARAQLREMLHFLWRHMPGFENATVHSVAHHIGVRESRRIRGKAYLTVADFDRCVKFPDAIVRVTYPIDIHNPTGTGTVIRHVPAGDWYEIPYGCIVPLACDNLLIGSRCISVDHAVHSSMRVMPPVLSVGQAAGMAAAMALEQDCAPAALNGREVRDRLRAFGAAL